MLTISSDVAEHRPWFKMQVRMPFADDSTKKADPSATQRGAFFEFCKKSVLNWHKKLFCEDAEPDKIADTGAEMECTTGLATTCKG